METGNADTYVDGRDATPTDGLDIDPSTPTEHSAIAQSRLVSAMVNGRYADESNP